MSSFNLNIDAFDDGAPVPAEFAFGRLDGEGNFALSNNRNPGIRWSNAPKGTQSFAIVVHDPDVPSVADDVNQEGRFVSADLPRVDFFHWLAANIPAHVHQLDEGVASDGITPSGKAVGDAGYAEVGANTYTQWFAGDPEMKGIYGGYDGPCPPWNDERVHRYHFTVYALSVPSLDLPSGYDGPALLKAMEGSVLATARHSGTYTLNHNLK